MMRAALLGLPLLVGACALDPFGEDDPGPLAESAAEATMQTYGELLAEAGLLAPPPQAAAAPERRGGKTAGSRGRGGQDDEPEAAKPARANVRQIAALPPANDGGIAVRVLFPPGKAELSPQDEADLGALAAQLLREDNPPVEILAYWSGDEEGASEAKLHAVKRAMKVRRFLQSQGVERSMIVFTQVADPESQPALIDVVLARR